MPARDDMGNDSLDRIERQLAIEEALIDQVEADKSLTPEQREQRIREIQARMDSGSLWDEDGWDDGDPLGVLVRNLGPKGPKGRTGIAVRPETESLDASDEAPKTRPLRFDEGSGNATGAPS